MGEDYLPLKQGTKQQKYENVMNGLQQRFDKAFHPVSNISNTIAILKMEFGWWWIGFYFVIKNTLKLGPFQGPPACTVIFPKTGVCGKCWQLGETVVVQDVTKFEGHIACSSNSKSQIVVPILQKKEVVGVFDIDSQKMGDFDEIDKKYLEKIIGMLIKNQQFSWIQQL